MFFCTSYLTQLALICVIATINKTLSLKCSNKNKFCFLSESSLYNNKSPKRGNVISSKFLYHRIPSNLDLKFFYDKFVLNTHTNSDVPDNSGYFAPSLTHSSDFASSSQNSTGFYKHSDLNKLFQEQGTETSVRGISSLCSYEASPHLRDSIQSRVNNYEELVTKYSVNPFPEISSSSCYDTFFKVITENESLENGEEVDRCYRVFGRVEGVRFDGHFMDLVNINKNFKNYLRADMIDKKLGRHTKIQLMYRLEEPILVSKGTRSDNEFGSYDCKDFVRLIDTGDVLEVYGNVKKTKLGEISIVPKKVRFLSKCFIPPPSKLHGLKEVETRFRLRHMDLLTNPYTRTLLLRRFQLIGKIRQFLLHGGFVELDTPILQHYTTGDLAEPFETFYNSLNQKVKLRIAPEFSLKKLFMGLPFVKVFEVAKCFRNEGSDQNHSPEFTMVEIYQKMADYKQMIHLFEKLVDHLLSYTQYSGVGKDKQDVNNTENLHKDQLKSIKCVYEVKWQRRRFDDLIKEHTGVDIKLYNAKQLEEKFTELYKKANPDSMNTPDVNKAKFETWGDAANEIFEEFVVPKLTYPVHVTHLPKQISPLCYFDYDSAKLYGSDYERLFSNRFESYLGGMEVANGCTEQCDPLLLSMGLVKNTDGKEKELDRDFLHSAFCGMEPMAGLGIGVDRLIMYLTNTKNMKEIQPFPTVRKL